MGKMKLSEFVLTQMVGRTPLDLEYFADVSVTEAGRWPWSKPVRSRRKIHRKYAEAWHFVDSGEWCPLWHAEALERAYRAQRKVQFVNEPKP